jgi:hypothetical protein
MMGVVVNDHAPSIWWSTANPPFLLNYPCEASRKVCRQVPHICRDLVGGVRASCYSDRIGLPKEPHRAVTDDRERLARAIEWRISAKAGAIDETLLRQKAATITMPAPIKGVGMAI